MQISEKEMTDVQKFIDLLNSEIDSAVIVEGKKDAQALCELGFSGKILEFHKFRGLSNFIDTASKYKKIIILLDGDRTGKILTGKISYQLQRQTKVDLSYKKRLVKITRGKIRFIEDMRCYIDLGPDAFVVKGLNYSANG